MSDPQRRALRRSAFRRSSLAPRWLGYWMTRFRGHEGLSFRELGRWLGVDLPGLVLLSLCRTPQEGTFVEDLDVVCRRSGANRFALANLLRQEQALAGWRDAAPGERGWLAAASDAEAEPDDPTADAGPADAR